MQKRMSVSLMLDEDTFVEVEAKAAADHRSLAKYLEHLVLCDLAIPGTPVATILVPEHAEGLKQVRIDGEDPIRARRRAMVADALFRPRNT